MLARRLWVLVAVLSAVVAALLVAGATRPAPERAVATEALVAAESFAVALASYDSEDLDRHRDEVLALSTGSFAEDFEAQLGGPELRDLIQGSGATATAEVTVGPLLADLAGDRARAFVVVEQTASAPELEEPSTRRVRMDLLLVRTASGWRVDAVTTT